ncbi:hypothetical protein D3C72_1944130 [compost metagenome]
MFFLSTFSSVDIPKFSITCLITLLLFINSLYVATNFELRVISVVVIVSDPEVAVLSVAAATKTSVVDAEYIGVIRYAVYIYPTTTNIAVKSTIKTFFSQNILNNSCKSISSICFSPCEFLLF